MHGVISFSWLGGLLFATACGSQGTASAPASSPVCPEELPFTDSGKLKGIEDQETCAYLGVPYAEPPVDQLRWRAAVPIDRNGETVLSDRMGSPCMQVDLAGNVSGDEDCLTLNLWRPKRSEGLLPVLVFFHGGGNVMGSAVDPRYHGARLAKALDALVVTVQFRVGALGYLVHPALSAENERGVSGNYGLLDQIEALDWLHRNAYRFDANPNRLTVFGQSAGARNICALLASLQVGSPFQAAILHSGACNAREYVESERYGIRVSQALGCELDPHPALCMRRKSAHEVTTASPSLPDPMTVSAYNPTIDGWLLAEQPLDALERHGRSDLPVVVGTNADETGGVTPRIESEDEYRTFLRAQFGEARVAAILETYPAEDYPTMTQAAVAAVSDTRYGCAARQSVRALLENGRTPYRFWLSHRPSNPPYRDQGATHGLELMYLFGTYEAYGYQPSAEDRRVASELAGFYKNFVHEGKPGTVLDKRWPSEREQPGYLLPIGEPRQGVASLDERCDFWERLAADPLDG